MRAWTPARWTLPLPEGHRFPIERYAMIRDGIVARGRLSATELGEPERAPSEVLELVHERSYGGGYPRDLADVVTIHANTVAALREHHG